jgi:hypothetical protein
VSYEDKCSGERMTEHGNGIFEEPFFPEILSNAILEVGVFYILFSLFEPSKY